MKTIRLWYGNSGNKVNYFLFQREIVWGSWREWKRRAQYVPNRGGKRDAPGAIIHYWPVIIRHTLTSSSSTKRWPLASREDSPWKTTKCALCSTRPGVRRNPRKWDSGALIPDTTDDVKSPQKSRKRTANFDLDGRRCVKRASRQIGDKKCTKRKS